jgi:tRNA A37 threonylcarbamoyladenosine dehydratase
MQEKQKLLVNFTEYANVFTKMVNSCIKEPHSFLVVFVMNRDGSAKLDFIQRNDFKFIELLRADFVASNEDVVRQSITYRYNSCKSKVALMEARLKDVNNLVKVKNPSLLLQLQKGGTQAPHQHQMSSNQSMQ